MSKRKLHRNPSEPTELKAMALGGESLIHIWNENTWFKPALSLPVVGVSVWAEAEALFLYFRKQRRDRYFKIS